MFWFTVVGCLPLSVKKHCLFLAQTLSTLGRRGAIYVVVVMENLGCLRLNWENYKVAYVTELIVCNAELCFLMISDAYFSFEKKIFKTWVPFFLVTFSFSSEGRFWDQRTYSLTLKIKRNMENQIKERVLMKACGKLTIIPEWSSLISR